MITWIFIIYFGSALTSGIAYPWIREHRKPIHSTFVARYVPIVLLFCPIINTIAALAFIYDLIRIWWEIIFIEKKINDHE
jgi:hypothetical protein